MPDASTDTSRGSLGGLAGLGFLPSTLPTQQTGHYLATDAGPYRGATPSGEMPPTYNPAWDSAGPPDQPDMPTNSGEEPVRAPTGRRIGGRDSKGRG